MLPIGDYADLASLPADFGGQLDGAIAKRYAAIAALANGQVKRRCVSRAGVLEAKALVERSIADVSDGLDVAALREQWAGRDLDALRGALEVSGERSNQLETEVETILSHKTAQDALDASTSRRSRCRPDASCWRPHFS